MKFLRSHWTLIAVALSCAAGGAAISAIQAAGAATKPGRSVNSYRHADHRYGFHRLIRHVVHGQIVVATPQGFQTITFDRGWVQSVSGQQLSLREGTKRASYRTVTLTIPSTARVRDDGQLASLSHVRTGQRALVVQAPARTFVFAHTPRR